MSKHIVVLTPHYKPESNAGSKRLTAIAEGLAKRGWRVTVVTLLPHHPQNVIYAAYKALPTPDVQTEDGVRVVRITPWIVSKSNLALRLIAETYFVLRASRYIFQNRADVILASSPYMFLGPVTRMASRIKGTAFVWDVRDLTWLYPRAAGKRTFGIDRIFERWMQFTARHSDALVTATEGLMSYFVNRPNLHQVMPNGVTSEIINTLKDSGNRALKPGSRITVAYTGLFGYNHGLSTLIEAAAMQPDVDFLLVGDGPERPRLMAQAAGYRNVRFMPYQDLDGLKRIYQHTDILVSHVRRNELFKWTEPAKLWEYMSTGKPVIVAGQGDIIALLNAERIAMTIDPENPTALAKAINELAANPEAAMEMSQRAYQFVVSHRSREKLIDNLEDMLQQITATDTVLTSQRRSDSVS